MNSRQRGAAWLLAALLAGRVLDRLDLPFERRAETLAPPPSDSMQAGEARSAGMDTLASMTRAGEDSGPQLAASRREAGSRRDALTGPIHVNAATASELQRLPGVGPVLAGRIVAHRAAHGPFRSAADLRAVRGIGAKTCARLAPLVRFD